MEINANKIYPNLFLIGGMRCGSTALHLLLDQHPDINMSSKKEPYFLIAELKRQNLANNYSKELEEDLETYIEKGNYRTIDKYSTLFDTTRNYKYRGEASHYIYHPDSASFLKKKSPQAKIIISVRNPIERLYSHFYHLERRQEFLSNDLDAYVNHILIQHQESNSKILSKGLYFDAVSHWIEIFGEDNVKIVVYEEFKNDRQKVISEIFDWLDLSDSRITNLRPQKTGKIKFKKLFFFINSSTFIKNILRNILSIKYRVRLRSIFYDIFIKKKRINIERSTRKLLVEFYKEDTIKLEKLLKKKILWDKN